MRFGRYSLLAVGILMAISAPVLSSHDPEILAIVIPSNSVHRVPDLETLNEIYRRKKRFWADGTRIEPVNLPANSLNRKHFSQKVLQLSSDELDAYWSEMYFHGVMPPHVLSSDEAVVTFVANTPGSIGYVSLCNADARVAIAFLIGAEMRDLGKDRTLNCSH